MSNQAEILKGIPEKDRVSAIDLEENSLPKQRHLLFQLFIHTRHEVYQEERFKDDSYYLQPSWFLSAIFCKSQAPDTAGLDRSSRLR